MNPGWKNRIESTMHWGIEYSGILCPFGGNGNCKDLQEELYEKTFTDTGGRQCI